jgi:hypothetical protein
LAAVAALEAKGRRGDGYDWRDSLYLGLVSAEAKAAYLVHLWYVVSLGTIENVFSERSPARSGILEFCHKTIAI